MKPLLFSLFIIALTSCQKDKNAIGNAKADTLAISNNDSINFERYSTWKETHDFDHFLLETRDTLVLTRLQKDRDTLLINQFVAADDTLKLRFYDDYTPRKLKQYLYSIDINGDGKKEIIYEGPTGGEGLVTYFFKKNDDSFEKIFEVSQFLKSFTTSNGKLTSFTVLNPGCCADPEIIESTYKAAYFNDVSVFAIEKNIGYIADMQTVKTKFKTEIPFKIIVPKASLRGECYIFTGEHPVYGPQGNEVASFKKGYRGKAIGYSHDNGKDWLYVQMEPTTTEKGDTADTFHSQPTYLYGWILKGDTDLK